MTNPTIKSFGQELWAKLKMPLKPFNHLFFGYFAFFILFIGGLGIWFSIYDVYSSNEDDGYKIAESLATFFIAVISSSFIQLNLSNNIIFNKSFLLYSTMLFTIGGAALIFSFLINNDWAFVPAGIGYFFAIIIWYVANCDDALFEEGIRKFDTAKTTGLETDKYHEALEKEKL